MKILLSTELAYLTYIFKNRRRVRYLFKIYKEKRYSDLDLILIHEVIESVLKSRGVLL